MSSSSHEGTTATSRSTVLVGWSGFLLGAIASIGISLTYPFVVSNNNNTATTAAPPSAGAQWRLCMGLYLICGVTAFHMAEFTVSVVYRFGELQPHKAFMLVHSPQYVAAVVAALIEFALEAHFAPWIKSVLPAWAVLAAFALCCGFYAVRVVAMVQCGDNFRLQIEDDQRKRQQHTLVRSGLYSVLRHPSYFGWFWFSILTQVVLMNPVCVLLYTAASWAFFSARIPYEESVLAADGFFGREYVSYARSTPIGIPFVRCAIPFTGGGAKATAAASQKPRRE
jgi:protein-S-isoprenylcysteine O-methyltransferase